MQILNKARSDQFRFVKQSFLMTRNAIFKSAFIIRTYATKRAIAMAFLCLLLIGAGASPILAAADGGVASANGLPEANGIVSADRKPASSIEPQVGDRRSVAGSSNIAGMQHEPLMLLLLGTMLLSIGAAIKLAGSRNPR
jgi:hypothetical protein